MGWLAFCGLIAVVLASGFAVWRKWVAPWKDVEELAGDIVEHRAPRKFLISGNPHARRVGLALEKLTDRRRELDERMRESELSVQAVFGAMLDGLVVVDGLRRVRLVNLEFRRVFGLRENAPGETLLEVIRHAAVDRMVMEAIRTAEPGRESIRTPRDGTGESREMEVTAVPLGENSAQMEGAVVLFRDVTQFRQVEEIRRDFVANVSHELRTPLSIFRGYLETLLDDPHQPPAELLRILEIMERHSDRLNALVEDVLSLARLESPGMELDLAEVDLAELLHSIMRDWEKRFAARQLKSHLNFPGNLPALHADENRLQEVIYNLLDNAVKYSQPGGTVSLRAEMVDDRVRISVADQGIGIREADLPRIFERFYRADKARSREFGGTGLGLSIVKHIVQLHGGSVEAESEPGKGTTISVSLPVNREAD
ncbi:MAG: two-component system, OmpR family, phosphate regulon sensor histidine kinase PhoR [Verrucomicrobiota bacterium]|jgi:two-component system phosphate regulon sensor histidine kinase PhoR